MTVRNMPLISSSFINAGTLDLFDFGFQPLDRIRSYEREFPGQAGIVNETGHLFIHAFLAGPEFRFGFESENIAGVFRHILDRFLH